MEETSRFYCSELSRRASERPFGTASIGAVWLLLEYPHGWGRRALEDSALSAEVKDHFTRACEAIRHSRLLFIKTDRALRDARMSFFVVRCRERSPFVVRFKLKEYDDLTRLDLAAVASGSDLQGGQVSADPLFLVCTHGRRDKCCAKFGIPLYNALRDYAGESVWQSSHVGGDRFAGNLLCFPHGLFYAHTTPDAGRRLLSDYREMRMSLDNFRGRACYAHHTQAAELFVRAEAGIHGVEALRHLSTTREGDASWLVRFAERDGTGVHAARVTRRPSSFRNFTTCHSTAAKPVQQFHLEDYRVAPTE